MTKEEYKVICKLIDINICRMKIVNPKAISYKITKENVKQLKEDIQVLLEDNNNAEMIKGKVYKR